MIPVFDGNRKNLLEIVSKMLYHIFVNKRSLSLVSILESLTMHFLSERITLWQKQRNQH